MEPQRSQVTKSILRKKKARGTIASDFEYITKFSNQNIVKPREDKPGATQHNTTQIAQTKPQICMSYSDKRGKNAQ